MDRTQVIGLILIFGLIFAWTYTSNKEKQAAYAEQMLRDSIAQVEESRQAELAEIEAQKMVNNTTQNATTSTTAAIPDSLQDMRLLAQYGVFGGNANGEATTYTLENDKMIVEFSSMGGKISSVTLKEHNKVTENEERFILTSC